MGRPPSEAGCEKYNTIPIGFCQAKKWIFLKFFGRAGRAALRAAAFRRCQAKNREGHRR
nr:MAG TPA: hypothetical protein [Caudoviricetes sp.]